MLESRFRILDEVKNESNKLNVAITASMAFAYGHSNLDEMDQEANGLLELVLARGGDQVAVKRYGKEVEFYGTSSETSEKSSKVRARVMAQSLEKLISESSNVIIIPHIEADLDALGASLAVSKIAGSCGKNSYIVFNDLKVEPKTAEIYDENVLELIEGHVFVNNNEANTLLEDDSLVVVVDHHSADMTSALQVVSAAKKIVIIDHHRRKSETNISAMMIYNEPASSSTVELVSELVQYTTNTIDFTDLESTIMYAGLLVDTDKLRSRTSSRTFEVCSYLKRCGANVSLANEWLKEDLQDFLDRSLVTKYMEVVGDGYVISAIPKNNDYLTRTAISMGADYICSVKGVNAAFVIAQTEANQFSISARSNGNVNVQVILEKMGGGGHFNAAGLQRANCSVASLKEELVKVINDYQKGTENESNSID